MVLEGLPHRSQGAGGTTALLALHTSPFASQHLAAWQKQGPRARETCTVLL